MILVARVLSWTYSLVTLNCNKTNRIKKPNTKASTKPKTAPIIFDGIPKIIVAFNIFSIIPDNLIINDKTVHKTTNTNN